MKCCITLLCLTFAIVTPAAFAADPATEANPSIQNASDGTGTNKSLLCPDAELWGQKMITGVCWSCIFPLRMAGGVMRLGDDDKQRPPEDATNKAICACPRYPDDPVPMPGLTVSYWEPSKIIELVRAPFCMPSLAGTRINDSWRGMGKRGHDSGGGRKNNNGAFYNAHLLALPLMAMLDMIVDSSCNPDGYMDFDLLYLTELDPTWSSDELALLVSFETMVFANPVAIAACMADATASTAGYPIKSMFWCAGTWGMMYPMTGTDINADSPPETTSLLATRFLGKLHRMGLARRYAGDDTLCRAPFQPTIHKTQYKMSTFFPVVEADQNHWIGESTFKWGEWRNIPMAGEDFVYILYRYNDCCFRFGQ